MLLGIWFLFQVGCASRPKVPEAPEIHVCVVFPSLNGRCIPQFHSGEEYGLDKRSLPGGFWLSADDYSAWSSYTLKLKRLAESVDRLVSGLVTSGDCGGFKVVDFEEGIFAFVSFPEGKCEVEFGEFAIEFREALVRVKSIKQGGGEGVGLSLSPAIN